MCYLAIFSAPETTKPALGGLFVGADRLRGVEAEDHLQAVTHLVYAMLQCGLLALPVRKALSVQAGQLTAVLKLLAGLIESLLLAQLAAQQSINMQVAPDGKLQIEPSSKGHCQLRVKPCAATAIRARLARFYK
ncbi:hypothetical protein PE143B_0129135 [Pseudomonas extremaustralis 14-3 substr. 14-3b]|nr:hypothetical protein PE143B_0129135 [Pseudomonas extremaustralis 14-3 substr. 14-3b]